MVMVARVHFGEHQVPERAFGEETLEPGRKKAVCADLVPPVGKALPAPGVRSGSYQPGDSIGRDGSRR